MPDEKYFMYHGRLISFANFGNLNYGYTGTVLGIEPETLYIAGGLVADNPTQYEIEHYYSDSEVDHYWIKKGIEQAKNQGYFGVIEIPQEVLEKII